MKFYDLLLLNKILIVQNKFDQVIRNLLRSKILIFPYFIKTKIKRV